MKKILLCGLPGSGKTTLAEKLVSLLGNADWHNADRVREQHNDWDFSPAGRQRQMQRMKDLCADSVSQGRYAVADFVCPTAQLRAEFDADYVIWMNTIDQSRYEDTNQIFEQPGIQDCNLIVNAHEWWDQDWLNQWSRLLAVDIKNNEFDPQAPTTQMLGRFQPFHPGHRALFERALAKHDQVAIMVRDMPTSDSNPWSQSEIATNIEKELAEFAGRFRIYFVPNIVNITYGRDVGYKIEQEVFDEETHSISATSIREQMRKDGKL
jgi:adenylylsulfate kinase